MLLDSIWSKAVWRHQWTQVSPDTRPPLIRPIVSAERIVPAATMSLDWLTLLNEKQKCKIDPAAAVVSEASGRWEVRGGGWGLRGRMWRHRCTQVRPTLCIQLSDRTIYPVNLWWQLWCWSCGVTADDVPICSQRAAAAAIPSVPELSNDYKCSHLFFIWFSCLTAIFVFVGFFLKLDLFRFSCCCCCYCCWNGCIRFQEEQKQQKQNLLWADKWWQIFWNLLPFLSPIGNQLKQV